jgi:hypothetical protein
MAQHQRLDYWSPNIFSISLASGIAALVVVSLLTPPEPETAVNTFFARLQTPSDLPADETTLSTKPTREYAEQGKQLLVVNLGNLRRGACGLTLFEAYRIDFAGLAIGLTLVTVLVAAFWAFLRLL